MKRIFFILMFLGIIGNEADSARVQQSGKNKQDRHEIIVEVNGEAITANDIEIKSRIMALSMGQQYTAAFAASIRDQVLDSLINDCIRFQEISRIQKLIKRSKIVSDEEVSAAVSNIAERTGMDVNSFKSMLEKHKVSFEVFKVQIFTQIAWNNIVRNMFASNVEVSDDEAAKEQALIRNQLNQKLYLLSRIYLPVESDEDAPKVKMQADRIYNRLQQYNAGFPMLAQQFSRAPESINGGWLGWVPKNRLSTHEGNVLDSLPLGVPSRPINTNNAYVILMLHGKRDEGEKFITEVKIQKVVLFADGRQITSEDEARETFAAAQRLKARMQPLEKIIDIASSSKNIELGAVETVSLDNVTPQLRDIVNKIGEKSVSDPILFPKGAIMFIVWSKKVTPMQPPSIEDIKNMLIERRLGMLAERYFRELRRMAYIKY